MGYSTTFKGELKFTSELTATQLAALKKMFTEDCRKHPEWNQPKLYYIDLKFNNDFSGLCWNGTEKTYGMVDIVNLVLTQMRIKWPNFGLSGEMSAQGEDVEDRWVLVIGDDGWAYKKDLIPTGLKVRCPHCEEYFILEEENQKSLNKSTE